ncbi:conserved exported hypothetical protein [Treponema phagedenis]|uniref:Extracellular solute-binding protein n=2 Tax=Treponema phagedenis TaxID=162 RepID=A0A0B7H1Z0_TREPH|nr:extracellular solute-binding protein [Treponema phagedenis]CEM62956.1 conserved exported hypothetical protein [Treponema phagedenis]
MKLWKFLSVLVVAALLIGCSDEKAKTDSDTGKLSFSVTTVDFGQRPTGTLIQNEWLKLMSEKMGKELDIKFEFVAMGDYGEKLKIMNAGGDIADVLSIFAMSKTDVDKYGKQGLYVDLSKHLDKMPHYKAALEKDPNSKYLYAPNGALYRAFNLALVSKSSVHSKSYSVMAIKSKVFKDNNIKVPETLDEVYAGAKKLKELNVSRYPIILHEEWQNPESTVFNAYHTASDRFYDGKKFAYGPVSDDYKRALQYMNKIYKEGLISPDYFNQKSSDGSAALSKGTACIILSCWEGYPARWKTEFPDDEWVAIPLPSSEAYPDNPWQFEREFPSDYNLDAGYSIVVSSKAKNLDEILKFIDFQYDDAIISLLNWGIEGTTFTVAENGEKILIGENTSETNRKMISYGMPLSSACRSGIFPQPQDMVVWRVAAEPKIPLYYKGEYFFEKLVPFCSARITPQNTSPNDNVPKIKLSEDELEEYATIMTPVSTFAREQKALFIKGDQPFSQWDNYLKKLNSMGDIEKAMNLYNSKL